MRIFNKLKLLIPLQYPIIIEKVSQYRLRKDYGYFCMGEWRFQNDQHTIRYVNAEPSVVKEIIVHEYAHALCFELYGDSDHSENWGKAYAACYRAAYDTK